jgi:hypothetical protein
VTKLIIAGIILYVLYLLYKRVTITIDSPVALIREQLELPKAINLSEALSSTGNSPGMVSQFLKVKVSI